MKEFEGKTAVVTGAASGIGLGLVEKFSKERMNVVMADVEEEALDKAVEEMKECQYKVYGIKTDVMVKESMEELFIKSKEEYGKIHILCNNAGIGANSGNKAIWEVEKNAAACDLIGSNSFSGECTDSNITAIQDYTDNSETSFSIKEMEWNTPFPFVYILFP